MIHAVSTLVAGQEVFTIDAAESVREAARQLREHAVGCLVVTDDGAPLGMLTDRDLALRVVRVAGAENDLRVRDVMTAPLVSIGPDEPLDGALAWMQKRGIRRVPVVEDGNLVGLITLDDVVELLARDLTDLGREWRKRRARSLRGAKLERVRDEVEEGIASVQLWMRRANWTAREAFLQELDDLRDRFRDAFGP